MFAKRILVLVISYLIGSISFSYLFSRLLKGIDIRQYGDKNAGATNVFLVVGNLAGILTLIGDVTKGTIVVMLAKIMAMPEYLWVSAGICAILGHIFPIYFGFRGGKGMATSIGVLIPLVPKELLITLLIWILLIIFLKRLSLAGLISLSFLPVWAWFFNKSVTIIIGIILIVLSRWSLYAFNFKTLFAGIDYQKLKSKLFKKNE